MGEVIDECSVIFPPTLTPHWTPVRGPQVTVNFCAKSVSGTQHQIHSRFNHHPAFRLPFHLLHSASHSPLICHCLHAQHPHPHCLASTVRHSGSIRLCTSPLTSYLVPASCHSPSVHPCSPSPVTIHYVLYPLGFP